MRAGRARAVPVRLTRAGRAAVRSGAEESGAEDGRVPVPRSSCLTNACVILGAELGEKRPGGRVCAISSDALRLDTDADQICFSVARTERPVLAERGVLPGGLDVRLLRAPCKVLAGPVHVQETAVRPHGGVRGPAEARTRHLPGRAHSFGAGARRLAVEEFSAEAAQVLDRAACAGHSRRGLFPGPPGVVTAMVVEKAGGSHGAAPVRRTWHTGSPRGQTVSTYSRLEAR